MSLPLNHLSYIKVKPFRCEVADCGKYFAIESSKIRHVNIVHEKIKPHRCSTCQIDFSTKSQFDGHTERVHDKIRQRELKLDGAKGDFPDPL